MLGCIHRLHRIKLGGALEGLQSLHCWSTLRSKADTQILD
jgi:hypothetical protein